MYISNGWLEWYKKDRKKKGRKKKVETNAETKKAKLKNIETKISKEKTLKEKRIFYFKFTFYYCFVAHTSRGNLE
jgi:hypothetical protein